MKSIVIGILLALGLFSVIACGTVCETCNGQPGIEVTVLLPNKSQGVMVTDRNGCVQTTVPQGSSCAGFQITGR